MTKIGRPVFYELPRDEALQLLSQHRIGRLAFTFRDRVDIEPISYLYQDGWIYARTSPGTKLEVVRHNPWVAFEIDEIEGRYDWRSVVVHGTIYFLDASGGDRERDSFQAALEVMRRADEELLTPDDPTPHRSALFRIHADQIIGRAARSAG
jgi:uncharacterized protein